MSRKYELHRRISWLIFDRLDKCKLTYKQFSESVELDEKTVIKILNLNAIPSSTFLEKFAEVHGINACWVLTGVGKPYLPDEEKSSEPIDEPGSVDPVSAVSEEDKTATPGNTVYLQTTARVLRSESNYVPWCES